MRSVPFLLHEAFANLRRHGLMTAAAITTITLALALLGGFLLTFYQVNIAAHRVLADFEMRIFCRPEIPRADLPALRARIRTLPGVGTVAFKSKDEVWAEQTRDYPIDTAGIPNLMNDTFVVTMTDPRRAGALAREIRSWHAQVQEVSVPDEEIRRVVRLAGFIRNVGLVGMICLVLGALVVVSNTIRISVFARRREIRIMQLVGATNMYIRAPFICEGLLAGLTGSLIAVVLLTAARMALWPKLLLALPWVALNTVSVNPAPLVGELLVAGAAIGIIASWVSVGRYLRV